MQAAATPGASAPGVLGPAQGDRTPPGQPELAAPGKSFLPVGAGAGYDGPHPGGTALFASSQKVPNAAQNTDGGAHTSLGLAPRPQTNWSDWATMVARPGRISAGTAAHRRHRANVTLEIGGTTIGTIQVKPAHVHPKGRRLRPQMVAPVRAATPPAPPTNTAEHVAVFRDRVAP